MGGLREARNSIVDEQSVRNPNTLTNQNEIPTP